MIDNNLRSILIACHKADIDHITFPAYSFPEEHFLPSDDKDEVTFHKGAKVPRICDKLEVCDYNTTDYPVWKDWYMTVNYHS